MARACATAVRQRPLRCRSWALTKLWPALRDTKRATKTTLLRDLNHWSAELCLKLKRYDEALAHQERFDREGTSCHAHCFSPWLRGRILGQRAQAQKKGEADAMWEEVQAMFENAHEGAKKIESPLMEALALQDMIALCPQASVSKSNAASRYEEACFELTLDTDTPLKRHLDSGATFGW